MPEVYTLSKRPALLRCQMPQGPLHHTPGAAVGLGEHRGGEKQGPEEGQGRLQWW